MKALVYTGPNQLEFGDTPDPVQGNETLIRVAACGICGSDMHAWAGHDERRPAPLVLGHEVTGTVIAGALEGQRVTVNPLVSCRECKACRGGAENLCGKRQIISLPPRQGGFAEVVRIPANNLVAVPDDVPDHHAALAEPLAVGWHAVHLAKRISSTGVSGATCVVQGGGAIGLGVALILKDHGAAEIMIGEPHFERRAIVKAEGFDAFDPMSENAPDQVDLVFDCVGIAPTRALASRIARPGGAIFHIGLGGSEGGLDIRRMTLQEITFVGTYTYSIQEFRDTAQAIFDGRFGALEWPEIRSLSEGQAAFADLAAGKVSAPKIILNP